MIKVCNKCSSLVPIWAKVVLTVFFSLFLLLFSFKLYEICGARFHMFLHREALVLLLFAFILLNIFIDIKYLYSQIFKYRYLLAAVVLVLLVLAKINFSSIGIFNYYVQPSSGSDFTTPIFGTPRAIRSDEWAVSTPRALTYQFCKGEKYNDIIMATETPNLSTTGVSPTLAILGNIYRIGYLFLDADYAVSFYWCASFIVGFMASIELCYIITCKNKLISVIGGILIIASSFYLWWSGNDTMINGIATCVCVYYFFNTSSRRIRILFGVLIAIFGASFVCILYPAWQVPFGYLFLAFIIWSFVTNFANVKTFKLIDWLIFAFTVLFSFVIIAFYLFNQLEYMTAITKTVYPGARYCVGGYALDKLFSYPASLKYPFNSDGFSVSEYGTFFSFFPFPAVLAAYLIFRAKKKDLLTILLSVLCLLLTLYCSFEIPAFIAKITLMYTSPSNRAVDVVSFLQILLLMRSIYIINKENIKLSKAIFIPVTITFATFTVYKCVKTFPVANYMGVAYLVFVFVLIIFTILSLYNIIKGVFKKVIIIIFALVQCAVAINVLPIQKGLDVIYSKPVATKVCEIVQKEPDSVWIANDQFVEANFYAACGAKVINSNNYMPNIEFWETIFPQGDREEIYNRYAHLIISLTEGENDAILNQEDLVTLKMNYALLETFGVDYIASKAPINIPDEYDITCENIYFEDGIFIYKLNY